MKSKIYLLPLTLASGVSACKRRIVGAQNSSAWRCEASWRITISCKTYGPNVSVSRCIREHRVENVAYILLTNGVANSGDLSVLPQSRLPVI